MLGRGCVAFSRCRTEEEQIAPRANAAIYQPSHGR
jgi:hypothetical protein